MVQEKLVTIFSFMQYFTLEASEKSQAKQNSAIDVRPKQNLRNILEP